MPAHSFGYKPSKPDARDLLYRAIAPRVAALPPSVDLRSQCSPVRDQGQLGSCTGFAIAVGMREFLSWTLSQVQPLAEALEISSALKPLEEMAAGGPNTAERIRSQLKAELGVSDEVPTSVLKLLAQQREYQVIQERFLFVAVRGKVR